MAKTIHITKVAKSLIKDYVTINELTKAQKNFLIQIVETALLVGHTDANKGIKYKW